MKKFYVTYSIIEGSSESYHYDVEYEAKHIDDVDDKVRKKLMTEEGINPDDVIIHEVLTDNEFDDLRPWQDLDLDLDIY